MRIGEFALEIALVGPLLITKHEDKPGVIGAIGTALGESGVNITAMTVGTSEGGGEASAVLSVADAPTEESMERVRALPSVHDVRLVQG